MSPVLTGVITYEQFLALPWSLTERMEVVRGVMIPKDGYQEIISPMSPGAAHGVIQAKIAYLLTQWALKNNAGVVGTEIGFVLKKDPFIVRLADVSFVRHDLIPQAGIPKGFWEMAPDVAIEVISPNETATEVISKARDYLDAGTTLVLAVYPEIQEVISHSYDGISRHFRVGDTLAFPEVLPSFECKVEDFFDVGL